MVSRKGDMAIPVVCVLVPIAAINERNIWPLAFLYYTYFTRKKMYSIHVDVDSERQRDCRGHCQIL